jgi:hypothetical protein
MQEERLHDSPFMYVLMCLQGYFVVNRHETNRSKQNVTRKMGKHVAMLMCAVTP